MTGVRGSLTSGLKALSSSSDPFITSLLDL